MNDDELEARLEAKIRALKFESGKNAMTIEDLARVQPGLARIMPEVGARTWKLYYAARAANWPMAWFQYKEIRGLMELGGFMRPKHGEALDAYLAGSWQALEGPIKCQDFAAFEQAFVAAIDEANLLHEQKGKPYIRWKLPDAPPPDLDLTPREPVKKA